MSRDGLYLHLVDLILDEGSVEAGVAIKEAQKLVERAQDMMSEANDAMTEAIQLAVPPRWAPKDRSGWSESEREITRLAGYVLRRKSVLHWP